MIIDDNVFAKEYDLTFPEDAEYDAWIKGLESDMAKLVVTDKTKIIISNDYSPFSTINS